MIERLEFRAMGCRMAALLDHSPGRAAARLLAQIPAAFEAWESSLSRFRPESELNRLNRAAGTEVHVSETLWRVLQAALQAERRSGGLVSAAVLEALLAAGYTQSFERLGQAAPEDHALPGAPAPSLQTIEMDAATRSVRLPPGMRLDFGGVAKGWAAQQALRRLEAHGPALVDAGGDIAAGGLQRSGQPWVIAVDDPRRPGQALGALRLGRGGVATSGVDYRRWQQGGRWRHHIIDPRTGLPAESDVLSATVIAPNVLEAETAAKTALILGSRAGMAWLDAHPGYAGLLVLQNGETLGSSTLQQMEIAPAAEFINRGME